MFFAKIYFKVITMKFSKSEYVLQTFFFYRKNVVVIIILILLILSVLFWSPCWLSLNDPFFWLALLWCPSLLLLYVSCSVSEYIVLPYLYLLDHVHFHSLSLFVISESFQCLFLDTLRCSHWFIRVELHHAEGLQYYFNAYGFCCI